LKELEFDRNGKSGGFKTGMKEDGNYIVGSECHKKSTGYELIEDRICNDDK
jgi:hypothetical protein